MIIGLARTSTLEQIAGLEAQIRDLEAYGCERVFKEQVSSVAEREHWRRHSIRCVKVTNSFVRSWIGWLVPSNTLVRS